MIYTDLKIDDLFRIVHDKVTVYKKVEAQNKGCKCAKHNAINMINGDLVWIDVSAEVIKNTP